MEKKKETQLIPFKHILNTSDLNFKLHQTCVFCKYTFARRIIMYFPDDKSCLEPDSIKFLRELNVVIPCDVT